MAFFVGDIQNHLAPDLKTSEIVIMDSLGARKCVGVREAIEPAGCELTPGGPPYSPDLNPIRSCDQR